MDNQQDLIVLNSEEKSRDYYWGRLVIVGCSLLSVIFAAACFFITGSLLYHWLGWSSDDTDKGALIALCAWIVLLSVILLYYLVQWIIFRNKSREVGKERERERERSAATN